MTDPRTNLDMDSEAWEQLLIVRETAETNMFDRARVRQIASRQKMHALGFWMDTHTPGAWVALILRGPSSITTKENAS